MYQPKISVVIPAYNSEKFILQTLGSVRDQDYGGIIETVVVDDCSKDGTAAAVRSFAETESTARPVVFIQNAENSGVAATRNAGVQAASGDYICYLDSDDFWSEDKVSAQVRLLGSFASGDAGVPADDTSGKELRDCCMPAIVCTAREMVGSDGKSLGKIIHVPEMISYKDILKTNLIPCSSVMLTRSLALEYPMERDDLVEDYICWLKILKGGAFAAGIDRPMLKYRVIEGSRSGNKLEASKKHYKALRLSGISAPAALGYFVSYAFSGIRKHF